MGKVTSLLGGGGGSKAARRAAEQANLKIDEGIAELRTQLGLDQSVRDEDIARFGVELGIFNEQQVQELEFRRGLEAERFGISDVEREEFQAEERRRFDIGQELQQERLGIFDVATQRAEDIEAGQLAGLQGFIEPGAQAFGEFARGTTVAGLGQDISDIVGSEAFGGLLDIRRREQQGQLSAGGLTRSGGALEAAADLPTDLAFQIQNQLAGRRGEAAQLGLGAAGTAIAGRRQPQFIGAGVQGPTFVGAPQAAPAGVSGQQFGFMEQLLGGDVASQIAQLLAQQGQNLASGTLAAQQAKAAEFSQGVRLLTDAGGFFSGGGSGGQAVAAGASFFSDPRLKENVEKITDIGDLGVYQWDWIPEVRDTLVQDCINYGFMADEVSEKYPQHVHEFGGFDVIDYGPLLDDLSAKYGSGQCQP